jgi:hypothetical protein
MPIAKITEQGLAAIALSVALLWGCVLGEHALMRQALRERAQVMRQLVRTPRRSLPVSAPSPLVRHRVRPTAG